MGNVEGEGSGDGGNGNLPPSASVADDRGEHQPRREKEEGVEEASSLGPDCGFRSLSLSLPFLFAHSFLFPSFFPPPLSPFPFRSQVAAGRRLRQPSALFRRHRGYGEGKKRRRRRTEEDDPI